MKLIERKNINEEMWANWCKSNPENGPFCQLEYLDAVAENLYFLIDEDYGGIALPYKVILGVKTLYTPVFCRWLSFVGKRTQTLMNLEEILSNTIRQGDFYFKYDLKIKNKDFLIYQTLNATTYSLNQQAKRKIKKAKSEGWVISWNETHKLAIDLIEFCLQNKFETLEDSSFTKLRILASNFDTIGQLRVISLLDSNSTLVGALLLIETNTEVLYLKGACIAEVKNNGGMYHLMNEAIQQALVSNKTFDFGGSRVPGVRKFNLCFGALDNGYFHYQWDNGPIWYSFLKKLRKLKKK